MIYEKKEYLQGIEKLRKRLGLKMISKNLIIDEQTVKLSRELDNLLIKYYRILSMANNV